MEKASFGITRMAELLGVSRSGYYAWKQRQASEPGPRAQRRAELNTKIVDAHIASDGVNGAPRILADLRDDGETVSRKTVAKIMRHNGIQGISPARWRPVTTLAGESAHSLPDLVNRDFDRGQLDAVWTSDITYLATGQGWLYLCAVRDGCSRRVLGWAIEDHMRTDLVETALRRAVALRGRDVAGVILHADRGCQYTSAQLARRGRRARGAALGRPDRGVLGQRSAGIVLVHSENRVLRSAFVAGQGCGEACDRGLDRTGLQPASPAHTARDDQPGNVRAATHDPSGSSRLNRCPPNGVNPTRRYAALVWG
ncbi:transposase InsO family protein [Hoyosella altamirensis]|uniref:Transposase InsO family protein n=1 Tax=Hoyosella altamirensis TaxID=616997 RepID=A0A839RV21_9ACTN|nr:transposase InsO family protein [Hoyosella altamirensis]